MQGELSPKWYVWSRLLNILSQIGQANHFRLAAKVRSDYAIECYVEETKRLYSVLESRLSSHEWLAGNKYTVADIASFC
jgi:glutathione S-transferase